MKLLLFFLLTMLGVASLPTITTDPITTDKPITLKVSLPTFKVEARYTHRPLVICQPRIDAVYRVISEKKIEMIPQPAWQSATSYQCQLNNSMLITNPPQMEPFSFETPAFEMVEYHYFAKEQLLQLRFNDQVATEQFSSRVTLYRRNALAKTALHYTLTTQDKRLLLLKINEPVTGSLELQIDASLSTIHGKHLSESITLPLNQSHHTPTALNAKKGAMCLKDSPRMVAKEDGSFAMRIYFDDTFYDNPLKPFVHIEGIGAFSLTKDVYINQAERMAEGIEDSYYYAEIRSDAFEPNHTYELTLYAGLKHYRELKEDQHYTLTTGDRKSSVFFEQKEPYLSNLGEIGFSSINVDRATLIVERVTPENYRYFINYVEGDLSDTARFSHEILAKDISLSNPKNQITKQKIPLKSLLTSQPHGIYRLTIKYEEPREEGEPIVHTASKVVFVSDIGIAVNLSNDQAFVSLVSLSQAMPIAQATVELYSANNIRIASATTNASGVAIINQKALLDASPKVLIVSTPTDRSFLLLKEPLNDLTRKDLKPTTLSYLAWIYYQSDIVRPASTIHALIAVKNASFRSASKLPVKVTLTSLLLDETIAQAVYTTNEMGLIDFSHTLSAYDKTGPYQLTVTLGDQVLGKKRIDVEAFMPPAIENHLSLDRSYYRSGEFAKLKIRSAYLFGAPASELLGSVTYTATAVDYSHPDYSGYSFTNQLREGSNELLYINQEQGIALDEKGETQLMLPCRTTQKVPSILNAMVGVSIMDDTQPVSSYDSFFIYPYERLVGLKLSQPIVKEGEAFDIHTVLLDPVTHKQVAGELSVILKKINWHYSYSGGHYNWERELEEVKTFTTVANQPISLRVEQNGEFLLEVHDRLGGHSATVEFEVSGWGYSNISPKQDLKEVEISFEKRLYRQGERLQASFTSPILEGNLLVTLEGEGVYWYRNIPLHKGVATLEIPLDKPLGRGLYLHATVTRKSDRSATIIPFRAMGYAFVTPDRTAHKIAVGLEYPVHSGSKRSLPLRITTDRESTVLVSVVDSGILNITEQKPPHLFAFFNLPSPKRLLYFDLYDRVMQYLTTGTIIAFGAGDMEPLEKRKKHLPPPNQERIKPFMLWSKLLKTTNKEVNLSLDIPQFNGKATIVAVAITEDGVGVGSGEVVIKDAIMIKPSYPRFLLQGDRVTVPIRIFNTTSTPQTLTLEHNSSANLHLRYAHQPIAVAPKSSIVVDAILEATAVGRGSVGLHIKTPTEYFSHSAVLEVKTPYPLQTQSYRGATSKKRTIEIPKAYQGGKLMVSLSDNPIGQLRSDLEYLLSYPYGCAEQTSSKIAALFYSRPFMQEHSQQKEADNFIRQGIKKLSRMQNSKGEFGYWEEGGYVNPYASLYSAEVLLSLDAGGYPLDVVFKASILQALTAIAQGKKLSISYDKHHQVYAGYILAIHHALPESTFNHLYESKEYNSYYFSRYYMAVILKKMKHEALAQSLYRSLSRVRLSDIEHLDYGAIQLRPFASKHRDMLLAFYLKSHYFSKSQEDFDTAQKIFSKLYSTHEKAMAFRAVGAYLGDAVKEKMEVVLHLNKSSHTYTESMATTQPLSDTHLVVAPILGVVNYSIEAYKALPQKLKNHLSKTKPLSVKREFVDASGRAVDLTHLEQGSRIYAKVTIANYPKLKNIVLVECLPACMESLSQRRLNTQSQPFSDRNLKLDYKEIRDDRVLYFLHLDQNITYRNKKRRVVANYTEIYTPLSVTTQGVCQLPALQIEAMYDSRISDYAKEASTITVKPKGFKQSTSPKGDTKPLTLEAFVKRFYVLEEQGAAAEAFVPYFHFPIKRYFGKKQASRDFLLKSRANYNSTWHHKVYTIESIKVIESDTTHHRYSVKIRFGYRLTNRAGKSMEGSTTHLLHIKEHKGAFKIEKIVAL